MGVPAGWQQMQMGEPTLLPPEETQQGGDEGEEYSFSETPISSINSTSSTSSSLPSTSTFVGRVLRSIILALRSCVNSKTKRILTISSVVSLCFVIGTIIYVSTAINTLQDDYDWVVHTDLVKVGVDAVYINVLNTEVAMRGYVITSNASYLQVFAQNLPLVWPSVYSIANLTTDNPVQIANIALLTPLIQTRLAFLNGTIADYNASGFAAAQADIINSSNSTLNSIRAVLNNMTAEESSLLISREHTFSNSIHTVTIVMFVVLACVALTIVAGLLVGYDWDTRYLRRTNGKLELLLHKAEEGTKMKSLFLANMSHEIRTPMNGILALSQLLSTTPLSADQQDMVDTILVSAEAMMRLITDLLLFSKMEAGKFTLVPEWFFLPTFLTPITEMFSARARAKSIEYITAVDRNVPRYLFQDSGRLRQVLVNLCDNAIKFTQHGRVKLHVAFVKRLVPVKGDGLMAANAGTLVQGLTRGASGKDSRSSKEVSGNRTSHTPNGTPVARAVTPQLGAGHHTPPSPRAKLTSDALSQHSQQQRAGTSVTTPSSSDQVAVDIDGHGALPPRADSLRSAHLTAAAGSMLLEERYYVIFSVTDSGIGIAPAVQKSIFEPFQQADNSTTREYGGTGLGLSISSQLVKSMGGRLRVRSQLGCGATFEFAVPVTAEQLCKSMEMEAKDAEDGKDDDDGAGGHDEGGEHDRVAGVEQQGSGVEKEEVGGGGMGRLGGERGGMGDGHMLGMKAKGVRVGGLEMMTIEEGDREHRHHHHSQHHDLHSRSVSSTGASTSASQSVSKLFSTSQPIKWHVDWFPDEYYDTTDRLEQKQMMTQAGLPEHFNTTPPGLSRTIHSAPTLATLATPPTPDVPAASALDAPVSAPTFALPSSPLSAPSSAPTVNVALPPVPAALPRNPEFSSSTSHLLGSPTHPASATRAFTNSLSDDRSHGSQGDTHSADSSSSDSPEPAAASKPPVEVVSVPPTVATPPAVNLARTLPANATAPSSIPSTTRSLSESVFTTPLTGTSTASSSAGSSSSSINRRRLSKAAVITPQGPRLRILVVEDNPVNQKVAKRLLEKDGHAIVLANNGQEALDHWGADQAGFDVVLMDLHMPVMDGLTATRSIRQAEAVAAYQAQNHAHSQLPTSSNSPPFHASTPPASPPRPVGAPFRAQDSPGGPPLPSHPHHIPIIAVTASALEEDANRCMESGFDDIIHKPIDIHLLSKKMGGLIAQKKEKQARLAREQGKAEGAGETAAALTT